MTKLRSRGEEIRRFIIEHLDKHPADINKITALHFNITRQAVNKHLQLLSREQAIVENGNTRSRIYRLAPLVEWSKEYTLSHEKLAEDVIWRNDINSVLGDMSSNVADIWYYGFTEMFNNVIDHSMGSRVIVTIKKTAANTEMAIYDNGFGIFKKIQTKFNLLDERHALLELSKGKLTTDPKRHSGEGIFFTSRMFDSYAILSGKVYFSHLFEEPEDWLCETNASGQGTSVWMKLYNHTARSMKNVFDQYSIGDDYGFNKTVVPVKLAQYGNDKLVSRSEAKRLVARIELFKKVVFDFTNVESLGQAFADEIFRVFATQHPEVELLIINANADITQMICRAKNRMQSLQAF